MSFILKEDRSKPKHPQKLRIVTYWYFVFKTKIFVPSELYLSKIES